MRIRVGLTDEAKAQLRTLAPIPKRSVREQLRAMEQDPYGPDTIPMKSDRPLFRVRVGDYRILFRPRPGIREITVFRIRPRETAYEGLERPEDD